MCMCVYVSTVNSRVLVVIFANPEFLCSVNIDGIAVVYECIAYRRLPEEKKWGTNVCFECYKFSITASTQIKLFYIQSVNSLAHPKHRTYPSSTWMAWFLYTVFFHSCCFSSSLTTCECEKFVQMWNCWAVTCVSTSYFLCIFRMQNSTKAFSSVGYWQ